MKTMKTLDLEATRYQVNLDIMWVERLLSKSVDLLLDIMLIKPRRKRLRLFDTLLTYFFNCIKSAIFQDS